MHWVRDFGAREGHLPLVRDIDKGAPDRMRQELVDVFYLVAGQTDGRLNPDEHLYFVIEQSLGVEAAGRPHAGRRQRIGRDIAQAEWQRVYDLIVRLWPEFEAAGMAEAYRQNINRVLAANGVVWELQEDGHLHRVVPAPAQAQIDDAIRALNRPEFEPARLLFNAARESFDARPRRDRDCCSNAFDAMESVAKIRFAMPQATFGQVLAHVRQNNLLTAEIIGVLEAINTLRNRHFGHGMVAPFALTPQEVDFTFLICTAGILLLI